MCGILPTLARCPHCTVSIRPAGDCLPAGLLGHMRSLCVRPACRANTVTPHMHVCVQYGPIALPQSEHLPLGLARGMMRCLCRAVLWMMTP